MMHTIRMIRMMDLITGNRHAVSLPFFYHAYHAYPIYHVPFVIESAFRYRDEI
jgi:hypothetical protein